MGYSFRSDNTMDQPLYYIPILKSYRLVPTLQLPVARGSQWGLLTLWRIALDTRDTSDARSQRYIEYTIEFG